MTIEERINKAIQKRTLIRIASKQIEANEHTEVVMPYWIEKSTNTLLCKKANDLNGCFIRLKLEQIISVWRWHKEKEQ